MKLGIKALMLFDCNLTDLEEAKVLKDCILVALKVSVAYSAVQIFDS